MGRMTRKRYSVTSIRQTLSESRTHSGRLPEVTDSGQPPGTPPNSRAAGVPPWAPTSLESASEETPRPAAHPTAPDTPSSHPPPPSPTLPDAPDVAATMRLIPVPSASTPPPPIPVMLPTPTPANEQYIGKYRVKGELGRGGMGAV